LCVLDRISGHFHGMDRLKRYAVTGVGLALVVGGVVLMPLPGPGLVLVVAGLAVLATEYAWARRLLRRAKKEAEEAQEKAVASPARTVLSLAAAGVTCAVGVTMVLVENVRWPVLDSLLDAVWGPVTGTVVIVTSLVGATTTVLALRDSDRAMSGSTSS
jgi:uncharacterized protein (TIGR02611 family)